MKRLLLAITVLLLSTMTYAQQRVQRTPEERATMQTEQMTKKLTLSDDQQKKVHEINLANAKKVNELREANAGDRAAMMEGIQKIDQEKDAAFKTILSEQQFTDYQAWKKERMEKMKQNRKNQDNPTPSN